MPNGTKTGSTRTNGNGNSNHISLPEARPLTSLQSRIHDVRSAQEDLARAHAAYAFWKKQPGHRLIKFAPLPAVDATCLAAEQQLLHEIDRCGRRFQTTLAAWAEAKGAK